MPWIKWSDPGFASGVGLAFAPDETTLVEHNSNDSYWGDGGDGSGKNMLGHILMEIREQLRQTAKS